MCAQKPLYLSESANFYPLQLKLRAKAENQ